jgi:hypothetical protein
MSHGPNDQATQWLLDQMHDPKVSLRHRIEIAKTLLELHPHEYNIRWVHGTDEPTIKVIIEGIPAEQPRRAAPDQDHIADNPRLT